MSDEFEHVPPVEPESPGSPGSPPLDDFSATTRDPAAEETPRGAGEPGGSPSRVAEEELYAEGMYEERVYEEEEVVAEEEMMGAGGSYSNDPFATEEREMLAEEKGASTGAGPGGEDPPRGESQLVSAYVADEKVEQEEASALDSEAMNTMASTDQQAESFDQTLTEG